MFMFIKRFYMYASSIYIMYIIILKLENQLGVKKRRLECISKRLTPFMTSTQNCESQKVRNNMNSEIGEYFIELCISIFAEYLYYAGLLDRAYK